MHNQTIREMQEDLKGEIIISRSYRTCVDDGSTPLHTVELSKEFEGIPRPGTAWLSIFLY